jgi:2OG-Fe(II) oxygenase superfamily
MSCFEVVPKIISPFPYEKWYSHLPLLAKQYRENHPFPHIKLENFLEPAVAYSMAKEFPDPTTHAWTHYKHHNENKHGLARRALFPPHIGEAVDELNSPEFASWLSALTGIQGLISDPSLAGGGLHLSAGGGFLNVHTDFSMHHYQRNWRRRVNLILYLNPGWQPEWGGAIEFWETSMHDCVVKYLPLINRAVIFTTDERSLHGFPEPLKCPDGVSRKSLALYYYTPEKDRAVVRSTNYRPRANDGLLQSCMIWLDKEVVDLYSRAKARFGFSDDLASRILGLISGKR